MEILKCLMTGIITGAVFAAIKLPIPAPIVIEGIVGIIGIFAGYKIVMHMMG